MESLIRDKSETTPQLDFNIDEMLFSMEGECRPENVLTFFEPIITWIDEFKVWAPQHSAKKTLNFNFNLEYYNSSSAKFVFNIFKRLKEIDDNGIAVTMHWHYDILDEDLLECGQEYEKILGLNFKYVAIQD